MTVVKQHAHIPKNDLDEVLAGASSKEGEGLREVWDLTGALDAPDTHNPATAEQVWQHLEAFAAQKTPPVSTAAPPSPARTPRPRLRLLRQPRTWIALAATLLIGAIGFALWQQPVERTAPLGERLTLTLPDGSRIELNSGATVRYDRRFDAARTVELEGEAFFDVIKDARPFHVETFNAQVTVLGTRFSVRAWPAGMAQRTTVALETGRVALTPLGKLDQRVEMGPGETRYVASDTHISPPDTEALRFATAWRAGDLIFKEEMLGVVLEDVERRFDLTIRLQSQALRTTRVHFALRNPASAEAVLRDLCIPLGLQYRETALGYELFE